MYLLKRWLLAFTLVIGVFITPTVSIGEDAILELLEEIRARMCHPIDKFGLPALDPLSISHRQIEVDNKYLVDFSGSVTNFKLTGLSDFVVNDLKISTLPLRKSTIDVTLPLTAFKSIYTAKGSVAYIFNLAGDGNAETYVKNVRVAVTFNIRTGVNSVSIRNLEITIKIDELKIDFENLMEEERITVFFHDLVNELGLELMNDVWQYEKETVENIVESKINGILGNYSLADIIKIITGGGDEPIFGPNDPLPDCKD